MDGEQSGSTGYNAENSSSAQQRPDPGNFSISSYSAMMLMNEQAGGASSSTATAGTSSYMESKRKLEGITSTSTFPGSTSKSLLVQKSSTGELNSVIFESATSAVADGVISPSRVARASSSPGPDTTPLKSCPPPPAMHAKVPPTLSVDDGFTLPETEFALCLRTGRIRYRRRGERRNSAPAEMEAFSLGASPSQGNQNSPPLAGGPIFWEMSADGYLEPCQKQLSPARMSAGLASAPNSGEYVDAPMSYGDASTLSYASLGGTNSHGTPGFGDGALTDGSFGPGSRILGLYSSINRTGGADTLGADEAGLGLHENVLFSTMQSWAGEAARASRRAQDSRAGEPMQTLDESDAVTQRTSPHRSRAEAQSLDSRRDAPGACWGGGRSPKNRGCCG
ncbi:unnamed protein product [Amoebophrya sp. A25]|nr:unnamed protein product [Amoebophrya sp. A25]|eukprot:GSA25T00016212001.1